MTFKYPLVGGHLTFERGHKSPSQKGCKELPAGKLVVCWKGLLFNVSDCASISIGGRSLLFYMIFNQPMVDWWFGWFWDSNRGAPNPFHFRGF